MNIRNNARAKNTCARIEACFVSLLQNKPIAKITVGDICSMVYINRSTFYAHYVDVYDLMEKVESKMSQRIEDIIFDRIADKYRGFDESIPALLGYVKENQGFYRAYLNSTETPKALTFHLTELGKKRISTDMQRVCMSEAEINYLLTYTSAGTAAIIRLWLNNDCRESVGELARLIQEGNRMQSFMYMEDS